jgi:hypothetical protein
MDTVAFTAFATLPTSDILMLLLIIPSHAGLHQSKAIQKAFATEACSSESLK